jgi:predicted phage terminase large subunit-like protein
MIADALERVENGQCKRLMVFMPPRHGKSELCSRRFPAWCLGRNPSWSIIAASYNNDLATDFGREVRDIVGSHRYSNVFDVSLSASSSAAGRWHTNDKGGYVAAGVGTAVTGRGAHVLLIDDPLKDRAEADSEVIRERVWRWYTSTAYTRLEGDVLADLDDDEIWKDFAVEVDRGDAEPFEGAIVLVQTRWHEDDLGGRLLDKQDEGGDQWEVLELPALDDEGQALWPQKYSVERLGRIHKAIGERDWSALYQQKPSPDEGTFFRRDWFERHKSGPRHCNTYITSDYAVSEGKGDWTEFGVWGLDHEGKLFQLDWWHGQTTSDVWIDELLALIKRWKPFCVFDEAGAIQKATRPALLRAMREQRVYARIENVPSLTDKAARARSFQSRAAMGLVSLLDDERGERVLSQLLTFPAGKHDDAVDVCSMMGMVMDQAFDGVIAPQAPDLEDQSGYRPFQEDGAGS